VDNEDSGGEEDSGDEEDSAGVVDDEDSAAGADDEDSAGGVDDEDSAGGVDDEDSVSWLEDSDCEEASADELLSDALSLVAELMSDDELSVVVTSLDDELSVEANELGGVGSGNGGVTKIVLEMMTVVTFVSVLSSVPVCLLVVSDDEVGGRDSRDVIVSLVNCRLTWRGK
jgi:hypothetical protein